ncbi:unnamed protein product [Neospora caninum Liverpool]|uniref:50S ribosomal protein L12, putative n=1 Tax=Neospora caninum (strain Liverpool) TaxID=572307 RepID=F0VBV0_NEOCL|nr:uncharacterized protein NCLIV_041595 [Neospora caninum Liverpool]CBZ51084.1 unnamed protein product [Neospora caninum Liverpool]CEL68391.1 TPA: 50S ribosomal protein L12, putative [Neospora caninum Liverpool]|eukprot:XP_003881117.1 uncharacterized protein NCLIV_041595 [Neospora caninum Liverpool]
MPPPAFHFKSYSADEGNASRLLASCASHPSGGRARSRCVPTGDGKPSARTVHLVPGFRGSLNLSSRFSPPLFIASSPSGTRRLLSFASPSCAQSVRHPAAAPTSPAASACFAPSSRSQSIALFAEPPPSPPASPRAQAVLEEIKKLTLVEAAELVSLIEATFGVSARLAVAGPGAGAAPSDAEAEEKKEAPPEKTQFDVVIKAVPLDKRIAVIKTLRTVRTDLGLKEAKAVIDALPNTILKQVDKVKAEEVRKTLADAGAEIAIE